MQTFSFYPNPPPLSSLSKAVAFTDHVGRACAGEGTGVFVSLFIGPKVKSAVLRNASNSAVCLCACFGDAERNCQSDVKNKRSDFRCRCLSLDEIGLY